MTKFGALVSPLKTDADAIVLGGGPSGLLAAREVASSGFRVSLYEDDLDIGEPEHCDGLVSTRGLAELGLVPRGRLIRSRIKRATLYSPSGYKIEIDAVKQNVIVLDRKEFDRELARLARGYGCEIEVGRRAKAVMEKGALVDVKVGEDIKRCQYAIDARGCSSLLNVRREGILQAAKYEVHGSWFEGNTVEVYFDQRFSPGFFHWVIPLNSDTARVGVAGEGINPFKALDRFLEGRRSAVVKKVAAPIVVGGPLDRFVNGRIAVVGDAAGQTKPTTAGGIYTGGVGGILAGQAVAKALVQPSSSALASYEEGWRRVFGREFSMMLQARKVFRWFSNSQIDKLFEAGISSGLARRISEEGDFDLHSIAFMKALGLRSIFKIASSFAASEIKGLIPSLRARSRSGRL